jgi:hypothetical protein
MEHVINAPAKVANRLGDFPHRLIERYGIDAKLFDWPDEITADCHPLRGQAHQVASQLFCTDTAPAEHSDWVLAPHLVEASNQQTSRTSGRPGSQLGC